MSLFDLLQKRSAASAEVLASVPAEKAAPQRSNRRIPGPRPNARYVKRGWSPTESGPLFGDFFGDGGSADVEIEQRLEISRQRSRKLARTNPYASRYFSIYIANVIGEDGIQLKPRVRSRDGLPDQLANRRLADEWAAWGRSGNCTVDGQLSWRQVEELLAISRERDGEVLLRLVRGPNLNRWGFAVELIEADRLDLSYSTRRSGGNEVRMGVEYARGTRKVVAYHILTAHPGDPARTERLGSRFRKRIPAREIIHFFRRDRIGQSRGTPRLEASMARLHMLGGYEEAEVVAARAGSAKFMVIKTESGADYEGTDVEEDGDGGNAREIFTEMSPGVVEELGEGQTAEMMDPTHPTTQYGAARKAFLQGVASGTPAGYNAIANDLEGVNFSSLRHHNLQERDGWKCEQRDAINQVSTPVYEAWLEMSLLGNALAPLEIGSFERYRAVQWAGKRWDWIDPLKEAQANAASLPMYGKTITEIAHERGRTVRDIAEEVSEEFKTFEAMGLEHPLAILERMSAKPSDPNNKDDEDRSGHSGLSVVGGEG